MKVKHYLHNHYQMDEIMEDLDVPNHLKEKIAGDIYNRFYEIGFELEYDENGEFVKMYPCFLMVAAD